jgi:hypothetical protein
LCSRKARTLSLVFILGGRAPQTPHVRLRRLALRWGSFFLASSVGLLLGLRFRPLGSLWLSFRCVPGFSGCCCLGLACSFSEGCRRCPPVASSWLVGGVSFVAWGIALFFALWGG